MAVDQIVPKELPDTELRSLIEVQRNSGYPYSHRYNSTTDYLRSHGTDLALDIVSICGADSEAAGTAMDHAVVSWPIGTDYENWADSSGYTFRKTSDLINKLIEKGSPVTLWHVYALDRLKRRLPTAIGESIKKLVKFKLGAGESVGGDSSEFKPYQCSDARLR